MTDAAQITFTPIAYEEFLAAVEVLANAIERGGWRPDFIVGIGRGGLTPGCFLSHRMGIPLLSVDHSSKVYDFAEALLVHLAACSGRGERYLFVDDINDTGKTLAHFKRTIAANQGDPANVRYAVLIDNRSSVERVDYAARAIDRRVDKDWFVFPWEAVAPPASLARDAVEDPDRLAPGGG